MFHRKRAYAIAKQVAPLLRELIPEKTDEERASVLRLFCAAHDGRALESLDDSHIDELTRTLRYYIRLRTAKLGEAGSPGIGDDCGGCQEFKASMLELMQRDIKFKRDEEGRVLTPLSLEELTQPSPEELNALGRELMRRELTQPSPEDLP